uniref:NADH-ubiquinone oxidoreductase chain 2 n=1 Tax=Scoparipes salvazai TaxID=2575669 RepID=A0A4D6X051_9HEMI|nr:NADH dehydrogenase subunit 2 [Scoparipes salvazai]QCI09209.1 NADH dehydrogenase subunit 2 [Scoparipes salvazai]
MFKSKSVFLMTALIGTSITLSSNNWISMWMGLELNMISFIPLIKSSGPKSSEALMMYFLIQSVSSMLMLFSVMMTTLNNQWSINMTIMTLSLLTKLGAAPFHMWLPEMTAKLSWSSTFMLLTWQKLAPLQMINNINYNQTIMNIIITLSVMMGAIGGLNQTSLRKLMGYSSINHLGWMLILSKSQNNWMTYMIIYAGLMSIICYIFHINNMMFINQITSINMEMSSKITLASTMLSMGGLPPFLGFLPKWMVIQTMIKDSMYILLTILVLFSLITLFYYLRIMTSMMLSHASSCKWTNIHTSSTMNTWVMMINLSLPLVLVFNFI